jgi:hypothetical protein
MALGHANNVANLQTAINHAKTLGTAYAPKPAYLKTPALETLYAAGRAALEAVDEKSAASKLEIDEREMLYEKLDEPVRRSLAALKISGATGEVYETAQAAAKKVTGDKKKKKDAPAAAAEPAPTRSASQMGYDNRAANFAAYVTLLESIPEYDPNEADLKITALRRLSDDLFAANQKISVAESALDRARTDRDKVLYANPENVVSSGKMVKDYVKSAFGPSSPEYRQISKLKFKKYE